MAEDAETGTGQGKHAGGRRPGETRTRAAILDAARACFAERGFDGTSLRWIAETAGVDQALVHHFYGSKANLFVKALELPERLWNALGEAAAGPREGVGERLVRAHLSVWEDAVSRPALMAMVRSAAVHGDAGARLREVAGGVLARTLVPALGGADVKLRTSLVATQLIGLSLMRYVMLLEPLASADTESVVRWYGAAVQAIVDGGEDGDGGGGGNGDGGGSGDGGV
ncbi:TetR family transcriptional regulator [Streptomyces sp. GZWMJZ-114]|uniref:TetR/AcrR family transcriptional regulator n=1 Tax=Streptomyces sp. GZWMJZ-114 TaxID=2494734 RepID=UPI001012549A|nr:TetR family transcriptional regulator [Streptomyces sp. GZWMJZ-114]